MTKIIAFILLVTSAFAEPRTASEKKAGVYATITGELLTNCEGADKKIAVAGFSYSDGRDSRDGGVVAERITTELAKAKKFKVIERKEIEKVFDELKLHSPGDINPDTAKEIGKLLGVDWIVIGTLKLQSPEGLKLNARVVDVDLGGIKGAANAILKRDWLDKYWKLIDEQNKAIQENSKDADAFYERGRTYIGKTGDMKTGDIIPISVKCRSLS